MEDVAMGTGQIDSVADHPLSCDQCPSVFTSLPDLEKHLETHKEERPYKCEQCERSYRHAGSLVNHRKTHEVGLFTCLICQKDFSNPMALKNHLRIHSEEKRFQCTDCGEGFRMSRQLSNHRRAAHSDMNSSYTMANDEDFGDVHKGPDPSMPLLRENHNLLSNLENYIAESMVPEDFSHLDLKDFPEPSVSSNAKDSPVDDQQIQSEERRYKCNQCDKAYKHAGSLANHRQSHTIGVYQCAVCFKEFSNLMALKNHSRIHTEYKPYSCSLCDQCFRLPTELASHQKLHTGERPFLCAYCGQAFVAKREFQRHKRLHANLKVEGEVGHLRTSEGSENSASEEDAIETSTKIDFYGQPFQEDHKGSPTEEPLSNHCGNVKELSNSEGSPSIVPQSDQQKAKAPVDESSPCNDLLSQDEMARSCADCGNTFHGHEHLKRHTCMYADEEGISQQNNYPNPDIALKEEPQSNENPEDRPYKCEQCGRTYRHAGSLINHKKTHQTGVYNCSICSKQLFNMAALKNHLRAHLKNKVNRGFDLNFFNSTNFLPDSFQCTDGSYVCSLCGESFANENDLQEHHMLHDDIKIPTASLAIPCLNKSPQGSLGGQDLQKSKEEENPTFSLERPRPSELAIANEIKAMKAIKREMGTEAVQWPSQVDEAHTMKGPDPGSNSGSLATAGFTLKGEDPCSDGCAPEEAVLGFQSQFFAEHHNHTSAEGDLSEYEGQGSQDPSTADDRPYKCELCDRTYRHRGSLVNHKHTHQTGIYQCSICPKQYSNVMALRNHVRVHFRTHLGKSRGGIGGEGGGDLFSQGMDKFYSCTMCGEAFEDQMDWHAHQLMHSSQKELQDYQNASDLQEDDENSIYGRSHMYVSNDISPHEDPSHYRQGHSNRDAECVENMEPAEDDGREEAEMSHICGHCGHIFDDVESLQAHTLLHEGEDMPSVETTDETKQVSTAKCEIDPVADGNAQESSEQMESLVGGSDGHTEKRMYECGLCDKSYRHSGSLINHKRTHQMGDYACAVCSKQFNNLAALKNHLRSHQRSKRERRLENSDHSSLLSPESSYSEAAFRGTSCDENFPHEVEYGSHQDQNSGAEATDGDASPQSKMLKDLAEDIRTLHNPGPSRGSGNNRGCVNTNASGSASGGSFPDDPEAKQIRPGLKSEEKHDAVDGVPHCGEETNHILQQRHKIEGGAKCTSPGDSLMQTDPSATGEGHAESSPDVGSTEERPYKCEECGKTYRHAGSLINHKHTHQVGIYQCSFCPKEYPNLMALRNHFRTHTRPQFNRSRDPSSVDYFGLPGELHQPRSGEELYDCSLCGMVFSDEGDFHQHQIVHGNCEAPPCMENTRLQKCSEGGQYDCAADGRFAEMQASDFTFHMHAAEKELLSRLKREMKEMDQGDVQDGAYFSESHLSHICGYCGKTYDDLESLKAHSLSHSDENAASAEDATGCFRVGFEKLNLHTSQVSEPEGAVNKSEMLAKSNFLIDDPKNNEGPESRPYACNQCGKTYRHGGSLVNHKKTHQIGDYQCSGCSRQYPNLAAYRNHLRHHPKCKELASTNDELKVSQVFSESGHPGGSGEVFGHSSGNEDSLKEAGADQLHQLYNNAIAQEDHVHSAEMTTKISNIEDCSTEATKTSHHADHGDGGLLGDITVDHKLHVAVPNTASDNATGNINQLEEFDTVHAVDTKPQICNLCGQICDGAVGLENHKTVCTRNPKEDTSVASSNPGSVDTSKIPTSTDFDCTDHLNNSLGFGDGPFQQRPFRCEVCGRTYRHAGSLINHKQTHKTGLFRCSVCQKRFFNMMALKNHNRIHFEMKRYKCPDCGKAFRLQKQLLTHQKMHRERAALAKRPSRHGKREVKVPVRLLDELAQMDRAPSGASLDTQHGNDKGERKVNLKRRRPKKTLNPDERPYRCEQCGRSYRHAGSLLNHKRSHTTGHYSCSICDKTYPNLMAMKNHQRIHFEVKRYTCSECGKAFKWQRQLTRHQLLHTLKPHVCDLCGQAFQGKSLFEKHQMEHKNNQGDGLPVCTGDLSPDHPGREVLEKTLKIPVTSRRTGVARRRIRTFRSDIGRAHKNLVIQDCEPICQACRSVFNSFEELEAHHCEYPANGIPVTDSLPVQASDGTALSCNQKLEDGTARQEDTGECPNPGQVEERPYRCNVCGRTYRHAGSLLNHKNTHTTGLFKCSVCLKQFFNPMAIKNHLRIHTAKKRFQCQECGKAFRASRELITHHRVHTGERPFNCPVCHRGFSSKLSLKQHQQVHNSVRARDRASKADVSNHTEVPSNGLVDEGVSSSADDPASDSATAEERPYKCDQCERAYRHAGSLLNHKKTHTTGVYHCPTCHKQFFNLLAMKNHLRIHMDQNRYKCLDCGKAFRVSSRLASHRRIHAQGGPFSCPLCAKKFFRKSTFQRHQLLHKDREGTPPQDGMAPNVLVEVT